MNIFNQVIEAHAAWTGEVLKVFLHQAKVGLEVKNIVDAHLSYLEQWLDEVGNRYPYVNSLKFVRYEHERFQTITVELLDYLNLGREELAREMVRNGGAFRKCSNLIVAALLECSRELNAPSVKAITVDNTVSEILAGKAIQSVIKIASDAPVGAAIKLMAEHNIGALAVFDKHEFLGLFTERGYCSYTANNSAPPSDLPVARITDINIMTVQPEDTLEHCLLLMTSTRTRHLPVTEQGALIGLVSIGDIVKKIVRYCG